MKVKLRNLPAAAVIPLAALAVFALALAVESVLGVARSLDHGHLAGGAGFLALCIIMFAALITLAGSVVEVRPRKSRNPLDGSPGRP